MEPKIIETQEQYRRYLGEVERLAARDPNPDSAAGGRLELLAKLVEDYEKVCFKFRKPGLMEAILFSEKEKAES